MSLALFPILQPAPEPWVRLSAVGCKTRQHWRHESGWEIRHCGHPTAHWPYYLIDPAHPDDMTMTHNGKGVRHLDTAKTAVVRIVAGELHTTEEQCVRGIRRIVEVHIEA